MNTNVYAGKRVTVMGLGRFGGGIGAIRYFVQQGAHVTVSDMQTEDVLRDSIDAIEQYDCRIHIGEHRREDFTSCDVLCVNPAVAPDNPFVELASRSGAEIVTEMGLFFRYFPGTIIGVTGSNGKSTTVQMIYSILRSVVPKVYRGGNIGISLLPDIETYTHDTIAVLELSSFQLYRLHSEKRSPHISVITSISPNHLDWHGNMDSYIRAKEIIVRFQKEDDYCLYPISDTHARRMAHASHGKVVSVGNEGDIHVSDTAVYSRMYDSEELCIRTEDIPVPGMYNRINAAYATGVSLLCGASVKQIAQGIRQYQGLPHRLEHVGTLGNINFYDDSISTTPESACAAVETYKNTGVYIIGGYDKGLDLYPLAKTISRAGAAAVCIGATSSQLKKHFNACSYTDTVFYAETLEEAVHVSIKYAQEHGKTAVVLSPGCASYDMFRNYEHRAEVFVNTISPHIS